MSEVDVLVEHLESSPRILLLGQRLLGIDGAANPLFRMPQLSLERTVYEECLGEHSQAVQAELDAVGSAMSLDKELDLLRRFPWRCIFTSAIDPTPYRLFHDAKKRPVTPAFESRSTDSTSLTLYRLFGATGRKVSAELPPTSRSELANRRTSSSDMLGQIPLTVGPSGRLFVVGWHPSKKDWLRPRDLATPLNRLTVGQILIFGLDQSDRDDLEDDDDFSLLIEIGKVVLFEESLSDLLTQAEERGVSVVDDSLVAADSFAISVSHHTPKKDSFAVTDRKEGLTPIRLSLQEYKRLSETLLLPGDLPEAEVPTGTTAEVSLQFLEFLGRDPLHDLLVCEAFAFRRPVFTNEVLNLVLERLDTSAPQQHTVVLTGQSGAGKSIMMALLAVTLRRAGIPVIIVASQLMPPNRRHIEDFLQLVDSHSSVATIILWDGLERPEEYQRLSRWVSSLGKKALVVGTSYELGVRKSPSKKTGTVFIDISIDAEGEKDQLIGHFGKYLPDYKELFRRYEFGTYTNFFELIYFLTSASRQRLTSGLDAEVASHVQSLDSYFQTHVEASEPPLSAFGHAIRDAYGERFDHILSGGVGDEGDTASVDRTPAVRLVESVMVVSSLGLPMPQSIALSLCHDGNEDTFRVYQDAFRQFPIIDAYSRDEQHYFVRARLRLEAEIWTSHRFASRLDRLRVILDVARKIRPSEVRRHKSDELEFVVRLLQTIGSEGPDKYRISEGYERIANCVSEIQQRCGRVNPRLLLLKANSLREHVQQDQIPYRNTVGRLDSSKVTLDNVKAWDSFLSGAEQAIGEAEAEITQHIAQAVFARGSRMMLSVLSTEKAATIGGQLICLAAALQLRGNTDDFRRLGSTLDRARRAWRVALTIDEENVRATDTACWIIRNFLNECPVRDDEKYELLAEWNEQITRYAELDLNPDQLTKFERRDYEFSTALGDRKRLLEIVDRSTLRGNYGLHALNARGLVESDGPQEAMDYLRTNCGDVLTTERVILLLYYRLWWQLHSGYTSYFSQDEVLVAFSGEEWEELLTLARGRLGFEGESENQLAIFHAAWASLALGRSKDTEDMLKVLDTISVGNFRRGRALVLLSDSDGQPREFTGEARPGLYSHKGKVWIEDLRLEIPYMTAHFPETESGGTISGFHVAMNYRGAFVQPASIYSNKQARLAKQARQQV